MLVCSLLTPVRPHRQGKKYSTTASFWATTPDGVELSFNRVTLAARSKPWPLGDAQARARVQGQLIEAQDGYHEGLGRIMADATTHFTGWTFGVFPPYKNRPPAKAGHRKKAVAWQSAFNHARGLLPQPVQDAIEGHRMRVLG